MMLYVCHCMPWFGGREEVSMLTGLRYTCGHPALQAGYIVNTQRTACVPCAQGKFSDTPGAAVPWSSSCWALQVWHSLPALERKETHRELWRLQRVYQQSWVLFIDRNPILMYTNPIWNIWICCFLFWYLEWWKLVESCRIYCDSVEGPTPCRASVCSAWCFVLEPWGVSKLRLRQVRNQGALVIDTCNDVGQLWQYFCTAIGNASLCVAKSRFFSWHKKTKHLLTKGSFDMNLPSGIMRIPFESSGSIHLTAVRTHASGWRHFAGNCLPGNELATDVAVVLGSYRSIGNCREKLNEHTTSQTSTKIGKHDVKRGTFGTDPKSPEVSPSKCNGTQVSSTCVS